MRYVSLGEKVLRAATTAVADITALPRLQQANESLGFFERHGFEREGFARKAARTRDGGFTDVALMARVT